MEREKGVADLIRAWQRLGAPTAQLLLVGSPGRKDPVPTSELPLGVEHRPWTLKVEDYLVAADVVVLPSYVEGMSNALLEAMAMGITCIATRVGAAAEMMEGGQAGLLVDPGDGTALAEALGTAIADADLRARIGARGRDAVRRRYDITKVVDAIEEGYRSLAPAA
jgi:glycosyltransferase involved in cell wall biosynthesis